VIVPRINATAVSGLLLSVGAVLILTTTLASAPNATPPANQEVIARIKSVQLDGKNSDDVSQDLAAVIRANNGVIEAAQKGAGLYANDQIRTGSNAQIFVAVEETSARGWILIKPNSRIKLQQDSVSIDVGGIFNRVKGLFSVKIQHFTLGPVGTEFEVEVRQDGVAQLIVLEGQVQVEGQGPLVGGTTNPRRRFLASGGEALFKWAFPVERSIEQTEQDTRHGKALLIDRLQEAVLPVDDRPPRHAQTTTEQRVQGVLNWTNELILSSEPTDPVANLIPNFLIAEQRNAEFRGARYKAIWKQENGSHERLGNVYNDWGEGTQALEEYKKEQNINPEKSRSPSLLTGLAEALRITGQLDAASQQAGRALELDNQWAPAKNTFGNITVDQAALAYRRGDNEKYKTLLGEAVARYQEAFRISIQKTREPQSDLTAAVTKLNEAKAYFALGDIAEEQRRGLDAARDYEAAKLAFDRAKNLAPDYLARSARNIVSQKCDQVKSAEECHAKYPTGCSLSGSYDAFLNLLKNRIQFDPNSKPVGDLTLADFTGLERNIPAGIAGSNHADYADALADLGEGRVYSMIGYLFSAHRANRETVNCQLSNIDSLDYHLALIPGPVAEKNRRLQAQSSIVVEVTPHYRAQYHQNWTLATLGGLLFARRQVMVVGQLLLDNAHLRRSDDCGIADADLQRCWRASAWELHPVIQLYVCDSNSPCTRYSHNWKRIGD
jgi:tetratricopeptide (TPR) repeat protein